MGQGASATPSGVARKFSIIGDSTVKSRSKGYGSQQPATSRGGYGGQRPSAGYAVHQPPSPSTGALKGLSHTLSMSEFLAAANKLGSADAEGDKYAYISKKVDDAAARQQSAESGSTIAPADDIFIAEADSDEESLDYGDDDEFRLVSKDTESPLSCPMQVPMEEDEEIEEIERIEEPLPAVVRRGPRAQSTPLLEKLKTMPMPAQRQGSKTTLTPLPGHVIRSGRSQKKRHSTCGVTGSDTAQGSKLQPGLARLTDRERIESLFPQQEYELCMYGKFRDLSPGSRVWLMDFATLPMLNGATGVCTAYDCSLHVWVVTLDDGRRVRCCAYNNEDVAGGRCLFGSTLIDVLVSTKIRQVQKARPVSAGKLRNGQEVRDPFTNDEGQMVKIGSYVTCAKGNGFVKAQGAFPNSMIVQLDDGRVVTCLKDTLRKMDCSASRRESHMAANTVSAIRQLRRSPSTGSSPGEHHGGQHRLRRRRAIQ
eukprot:TRINITY_DN121454_c0_g1_i1.p1 TRINITY_DN121454_c0_g1~~TRINITY_DN121454_c0_g1_i1.p1  ORF type:complete len:481 (-),score=96.97 TRINITY_DN121454_c0_g1_i1:84-1526(-)